MDKPMRKITNQSYDAARAARLPVERAWVYRLESAWFYSHHPHLAFFRDSCYAILPIVPNHGPHRTASGRLIISGNISFPYTDDPRGLRHWRMTGIYPKSMAVAVAVVDDSESFWNVQAAAGWPVGLCEGSFYQTDDGVLQMLLRTNTERLWLTESADDGATWSPPQPTEFSDNATKFDFGRLPNGRFYYVGCPDPEPRGKRSPLVLSLSADGARFDRHFILADDANPYTQRAPGMHKGRSRAPRKRPAACPRVLRGVKECGRRNSRPDPDPCAL